MANPFLSQPLTSNEDLQRDGPIISATLPEELTADHILLPWHRDGHPRTGLTKRAAVIGSWLTRVGREAIERISGRVRGNNSLRSPSGQENVAERLLGDS
jgi:hypothetical protein